MDLNKRDGLNVMNRTESGNFAVGDPMSYARIESEAQYAIEHNIDALCETEEGLYLKRVFESKSGMVEDELFYDELLCRFVQGFLFASELPSILRDKKTL